jgi:hypothetical protein
MRHVTTVFPAVLLGIALACLAYLLLHRMAAAVANRRRSATRHRPGIRHERPALEWGVFGWTLRGLVVALAFGGTLMFCFAVASQETAEARAALAREWRITGVLLGAWAGTVMGVAFWMPVRLERVMPLSLRADEDALEVRFVDGARRIPWGEVALLRPSPDEKHSWLVAKDLVLLLPGPWRPAGEDPPGVIARILMAHRAPMRLRDMPLHDDLVAACGEPKIGPVPALSMLRAMRLPLAVLIASMALLVVGVWRMEIVQGRAGIRDAPAASRTHP